MFSGIRYGLMAICSMLATALPVRAEEQTFADLLARAKAQVASGHRWAPPGDNMTETVMTMMNLVPTATPEQLSALSALLDSEKSAAPAATSSPDASTDKQAVVETRPATETQSAEEQPTQASPAPSTGQNPPTAATTAPIPQEVLPAGSGPEGADSVAVRQVTAEQIVPVAKPSAFATAEPAPSSVFQDGSVARGTGDVTPHEKLPSETTPDQITPDPVTPSVSMPNLSMPNLSTPSQLTPSQLTPESGRHAAVLYARGLDAELRGDFSAARRFYSTAAQQGDAAAARNLGRLYDPAFIKKTAIGGVDPDPALARHWYERAVRLGDIGATPLLEALSTR